MIKILPQIILGMWGIVPGNYSGITHVRDNVYAVVDDKDKVDGFKLLTLDIDTVSGKVRDALMVEPEGMKKRRAKGISTDRDCEGVAYFNPANTIFVSGEEDQRILEYSLDGTPTGRELQIPPSLQRDKIVTNLGFEALTYNDKQKRFWTTTEAALPVDSVGHLRFTSFDTSLKPVETFVYKMDAPTPTMFRKAPEHKKDEKGVKKVATHINGVPSLLALDDGRLIVMEREGYFPKHEYGSWVRIKLYIVDPKVQGIRFAPELQDKNKGGVKKTLLCEFTTHLHIGNMNISNYEGMCLGPKLKDGRQTIILIADSQGGMGNWIYKIKDHLRIIIL